MIQPRAFTAALLLIHSCLPLERAAAQQRLMTPEDLLRVERAANAEWTADGRYASVEIRRPGRWVSSAVPANALFLVDAGAARMSTIIEPNRAQVGFFGASWSPSGSRLAFFSIDSTGAVRLWSALRGHAPRQVPRISMTNSLGDRTQVHWLTDDRVLVLTQADSSRPVGNLGVRVTGGAHAEAMRQRFLRGDASVAVLDTRGEENAAPQSQAVSVDLVSGAVKILARGAIRNVRLALDRRSLAYFTQPQFPHADAAPTLFRHLPEDPEAIYDPVNLGTVLNVAATMDGRALAAPRALRSVDYESLRWLPDGTVIIRAALAGAADSSVVWLSSRGGLIAPYTGIDTIPPRIPPAPGLARPTAEARSIGQSPTASAALFVVQRQDSGTTLLLARRDQPAVEIWRGNSWVSRIRPGVAQHIRYADRRGQPLDGWILLPPSHRPGVPMPMIAVVYPGSVHGARQPSAFNLTQENFLHPQLLASLGYGVILPSIREAPPAEAFEAMGDGVFPLLDTLIRRGIADSGRIGVMGQSGGGYATLALVTQTSRFRSAVASASYSNLVSLYGTFYGQYRNGDSGHPGTAQLLRMLMLERGFFNLGEPPWLQESLYLANSPIMHVERVQTPVMLIHGELDFIPVQQAEEFYTALFRRGVRAQLLRYSGELHGIDARANVLDMWTRLTAWLGETLR